MNKSGNKLNVVINACLIIFFCGLYFVFLYKLLTGNFDGMSDWVLIVIYSSYLFAIVWMELQVETRKCKITKDGIYVKYILSAEKLITWEQFQQICLCFEPLKRGYIPPKFSDQEIICFVLKKAKKNYWGFWNIYSKRHFRKILFIHYSEEVMKELQELCPMNIIDMRNDNRYQNR